MDRMLTPFLHQFILITMNILSLTVLALVFSYMDMHLASVGSQGKEFVIGFLMNRQEQETAPLEIQVTSLVPENVTLNISVPSDMNLYENLTTIIQPGTVVHLELPANLRMDNGNYLGNKALLVTSDYEVSVFGFNKGHFSHDSFLALPNKALGVTYFALNIMHQDDACPCQVGVVSGSLATSIIIAVPPVKDIKLDYGGKTYTRSETFEISMEPYQVLQLQNWYDLSGLFIKSDHPVTVYSGAACTALGGKAEDLTLEQLPPTDNYGKHYIIVPSPSDEYGDIVKVLAREPNTIIGIEIPHLSEVRTILLQRAGQTSEFELKSQEEVIVLQANKPILVAYFTRSYLAKQTRGDSSMTLIPSVEQYISFARYQGVTTASSKRNLKHRAIIVCLSTYRNNIAISSSSDHNIPSAEWKEIGRTGFSFAILELHRQYIYKFQSAQPDSVKFGLWFLGYMAYETYGHPGGFSFPESDELLLEPGTKNAAQFADTLNPSGNDFMPGLIPSIEGFDDPADSTIPPKVEKIIAITGAVLVVAIVVVFKIIGCFYTLRESKV